MKTNAEKYLKDGIDISELASELTIETYNAPVESNLEDIIVSFFNKQLTPTLTDDERVILRNIPKDYKTIGKCVNGVLYVTTDRKIYLDKAFGGFFNHLFQFIQERRGI